MGCSFRGGDIRYFLIFNEYPAALLRGAPPQFDYCHENFTDI
jgi:hypothetical protein